ncbi:TIGR00341 family protein [Hyphococcus flavus]|uniref:TIGR00341 family protein n=1 Tax=Hyphococcus flavus TaxID=1866326 RepID=A0AAE9ZHH4_9PROT|nr:TIGR00341 family protein [Hyphococcus flavus]WDI33168.1 TIGR00341 family protein [Hyphococcus flavus]
MRLIEAVFPAEKKDDVKRAVEESEPTHFRFTEDKEDDCLVLRAFFIEHGAQSLVDELQHICESDENWRILVLPVEATAPQPEQEEEKNEEAERKEKRALREEIYDDVAKGASLNSDFFVLTLASTLVAALGLHADNIAAVIGAMVIAPLLGPILAVSLGVALGDRKLLIRSGRNAIAGLFLGFVVAAAMGVLLGANTDSHELMNRTVAGLDSVVLALAAGVAAALSIVTGVSAALVGVMVAVALLPPAAAAGIFLGAGEIEYLARSLLLLTVNVVCVMLAAQCVYFYKGVRPRTWLEQKQAGRALKINLVILIVLLLILISIIIFAPVGTMPEVQNLLPVGEQS